MSDFMIQDEGSIVIVTPMNDQAQEFLDAHVITEETQMWGSGVVVEPRYMRDLLLGMGERGLTYE